MDIQVYANRSTNGYCYGTAELRVAAIRTKVMDGEDAGRFYLKNIVILFDREVIFIEDQNINNGILEWVDEIVTTFSADVLKYRRDPKIKKANKIFFWELGRPLTLRENRGEPQHSLPE
jgi:hypothetical protein